MDLFTGTEFTAIAATPQFNPLQIDVGATARKRYTATPTFGVTRIGVASHQPKTRFELALRTTTARNPRRENSLWNMFGPMEPESLEKPAQP
ncbi:MAG: hypothetical protein QF918_02575, partial [Pirellulaceae bacterium]|nr:hypothetical protein [Pirellulaceae bacterium]